jgi:hypothetical protein
MSRPFKSGLDDLDAIGKRRRELFPETGAKPEKPFVQPAEPVVDKPPADPTGLEEYYGC